MFCYVDEIMLTSDLETSERHTRTPKGVGMDYQSPQGARPSTTVKLGRACILRRSLRKSVLLAFSLVCLTAMVLLYGLPCWVQGWGMYIELVKGSWSGHPLRPRGLIWGNKLWRDTRNNRAPVPPWTTQTSGRKLELLWGHPRAHQVSVLLQGCPWENHRLSSLSSL